MGDAGHPLGWPVSQTKMMVMFRWPSQVRSQEGVAQGKKPKMVGDEDMVSG